MNAKNIFTKIEKVILLLPVIAVEFQKFGLYFTAVDQQAISFKTVEYTGEFEPTTYTYTDYL